MVTGVKGDGKSDIDDWSFAPVNLPVRRASVQRTCMLDILLFSETLAAGDALMPHLFPVNSLRCRLIRSRGVSHSAGSSQGNRMLQVLALHFLSLAPTPRRNRALLLAQTELVLVIDGDLLPQVPFALQRVAASSVQHTSASLYLRRFDVWHH